MHDICRIACSAGSKQPVVRLEPPRLHRHLALFAVYRNYVRRRCHRDAPEACAATLPGLWPRSSTGEKPSAGARDWRERGIHPMPRDGRATVGQPILQAA